MAFRAADTGNRLLDALAPSDRDLLLNAGETVQLALRQVIETPGKAIDDVYFIFKGLVSIIAQAPHGRQVEVGLVGFEGVTGMAVILGDERAANRSIIQGAGSALRVPASALRAAMDSSPALRRMLLRYVHAFLAQASQTALANGSAKLEERLARWILMSHDRMRSDEMTMTHEFLSIMLCVRRPGVTLALHQLENGGLITAKRGHVTVVDRAGLKARANGHYGIPETHYETLFAA